MNIALSFLKSSKPSSLLTTKKKAYGPPDDLDEDSGKVKKPSTSKKLRRAYRPLHAPKGKKKRAPELRA